MAAVTTIIAAVGAVAAVGEAVVNARQGRKAAANQRRANQLEQKKQDLAASRERRQQVAQARRLRAGLVNQGAVSGQAQDSSVSSGAAQVGTQLSSNLSFLDQYSTLTKQQGMYMTRSYKNQATAGTAAGISQAGSAAYSQAGGATSLSRLFS